MLRHTCLRNEQNIVATKETLSQHSYHTEGKKNVATRICCRNSSKNDAQDLLGRDRRLLAATETCNKSSKLSRGTTFKSRLRRQPGPKN